jgi:hypothetical protein
MDARSLAWSLSSTFCSHCSKFDVSKQYNPTVYVNEAIFRPNAGDFSQELPPFFLREKNLGAIDTLARTCITSDENNTTFLG